MWNLSALGFLKPSKKEFVKTWKNLSDWWTFVVSIQGKVMMKNQEIHNKDSNFSNFDKTFSKKETKLLPILTQNGHQAHLI